MTKKLTTPIAKERLPMFYLTIIVAVLLDLVLPRSRHRAAPADEASDEARQHRCTPPMEARAAPQRPSCARRSRCSASAPRTAN
ncbi:MAG: hypothetical protein IPO82_03550 [Betaproteobacteria bacterium]|nr:hypothetical protein [Betaproteobacteria bacterium]